MALVWCALLDDSKYFSIQLHIWILSSENKSYAFKDNVNMNMAGEGTTTLKSGELRNELLNMQNKLPQTKHF